MPRGCWRQIIEKGPFVGDGGGTSFQPPQLTLPNVSDLQTLFLCREYRRHYPGPATRLLGMGNDGLTEAFARLSTSDSRLHALEALIKDLTPYEWRFVQSLINTQTFQCDLIGRLPVELVSQIFSYLDTTTPWRLQLVSRSSCRRCSLAVPLQLQHCSWSLLARNGKPHGSIVLRVQVGMSSRCPCFDFAAYIVGYCVRGNGFLRYQVNRQMFSRDYTA